MKRCLSFAAVLAFAFLAGTPGNAADASTCSRKYAARGVHSSIEVKRGGGYLSSSVRNRCSVAAGVWTRAAEIVTCVATTAIVADARSEYVRSIRQCLAMDLEYNDLNDH